MKRFLLSLLALTSIAGGLSPARAQVAPPPAYTDITGNFASYAIDHTAVWHNWLTFPGTKFSPNSPLSRAVLARAVVLAFAKPEDVVDPTITFKDVPATNWLYRYANIAVQKKWMGTTDGAFNPAGSVNKTIMDLTLIRAMNMPDIVSGINNIRTEDGYHFKHYTQFAYSLIASQLGFHWNYPNAAHRELLPTTVVTRADFAYALDAAAGSGDGWQRWGLQNYRDNLVLPKMSAVAKKVVEFALKYANHPYVYAQSSSNGFDCSGFVWWILKAGVGPAASRGYRGWSLPDRTSFNMAKNAKPRITYDQLKPLDIVTWDVEGPYKRWWDAVGHAGIYLGNGWFIHSSGHKGGVSIDTMGPDAYYWHDNFVWGRRLSPAP